MNFQKIYQRCSECPYSSFEIEYAPSGDGDECGLICHHLEMHREFTEKEKEYFKSQEWTGTVLEHGFAYYGAGTIEAPNDCPINNDLVLI